MNQGPNQLNELTEEEAEALVTCGSVALLCCFAAVSSIVKSFQSGRPCPNVCAEDVDEFCRKHPGDDDYDQGYLDGYHANQLTQALLRKRQ